MESKTKHIAKQIGSIIFYLISGLLILYILLELFIPDMTIKVFQFKPFVVITESMEPVINVDDMVIVYNPNVDELEVGDIITFRADINYDGTKEIITHYIYSITENTEGELVFRTNRYGSDVADTWILQEGDVIGVYGFKIPQLGVFVNFLKSPFGIAAIAVNVIVIGAIVYIVKSGKKEAVQQENKEA
jgi:signal peptidase